jgi:pantoate--beta-alanine ligase
VLYRALIAARQDFQAGTLDIDRLRSTMRGIVEAEPLARLDYAEVVDPGTWQSPLVAAAGALLVIAVRIGDTRLIDNLSLQTVTDNS